jgi:hypothetical protein
MTRTSEWVTNRISSFINVKNFSAPRNYTLLLNTHHQQQLLRVKRLMRNENDDDGEEGEREREMQGFYYCICYKR